MAPASNEEQFKFLISCIRFSNNGKVDFGQVAKECKIVSKGAAAKRYERMMRNHGIASTAPSTASGIKSASSPSHSRIKSDITSTPSSSSPSMTSSGPSNPKKRKMLNDPYLQDQTGDDDEALRFGVKTEGNMGLNIHMGTNMSPGMNMGMSGDMNNGMRRADTPSFSPVATTPNMKEERDNDSKERLRFLVKEESNRESSAQAQSGVLSMNEAVDLIRFYEGPVSYPDYSSPPHDTSPYGLASGPSGRDSGYGTTTNLRGEYGMHGGSQSQYVFTAGYGGGSGYNIASPRLKVEGKDQLQQGGGYSMGAAVVPKMEGKIHLRHGGMQYQGILPYSNEDSPLVVD